MQEERSKVKLLESDIHEQQKAEQGFAVDWRTNRYKEAFSRSKKDKKLAPAAKKHLERLENREVKEFFDKHGAKK